MIDLVRDSTFGQLVHDVFGLFPYADEKPGFAVPPQYLLPSAPGGAPQKALREAVPSDESVPKSPTVLSAASTLIDERQDVEKAQAQGVVKPVAQSSGPYVLVDWYGPDDPDRPMNWSKAKKSFVAFQICLLTFSVYVGSAIYTASIPGLMGQFDVSSLTATWGLTLFVLAYGIGPMILTPLQDMPRLGRNPVYILGLFLFVIFQLPILFAPNMATLLAFRFFTGFVGSPALATGGASMSDIFPQELLPYVIGLWAIGAVCGPITGPVIGNFAAQANGWKWPILELIWISAFSFGFLFLLLPETLESTILLKRARRLRKLTGNMALRSQGEIQMEKDSAIMGLWYALLRPFQLAGEPAVLFANVYIGLVYGIFYLWFEAFPLVFEGIYHFNQGVSGLPYLSFIVSGTLTFTSYVLYNKFHIEPRYKRHDGLAPEVRLEIGLLAGICIPISLLIFGWASRPSVHWIVPTIGASIYLPGIYLCFQSILMYLSMSYPPSDAASILAGNDFFRSTVAAFFPLFGRKYFQSKLGLGGGSTLLAGLSLVLVVVLLWFLRNGHRLRARSKYAQS